MIYSRKSSVLSNDINSIFSRTFGNVGNVFNLPLNQLIKSLFANGEQGFVYDPNDLSTMFQDAAGTIPVTGVGQLVGLILDKSKRLTLSSNIVVNGTFSAVKKGWNDSGNWWSIVNGKAYHAASSNYSELNQTFTPVNNACEITFDYEVITSTGTAQWFYLNASGALKSMPIPSGVGSVKYIAYDGIKKIAFARIPSNTAEFYIDNVSVKEIAGNHAYQTNAASRPLLQRNSTTGAYYLEFDGTDDFLVTSSIDFTATDKVSLFAGVLKTVSGKVGAIFEFSSNPLNNYGTFGVYTDISPSIGGVAAYSRGTATVAANVITTAMAISLNVQASISQKMVSNSINGKSVVSTQNQGAGNYGNYPIYIGRRGGSEFPFNGQIYSLIGVGRLTTDAETTAIEKELAKRVGVTLNV